MTNGAKKVYVGLSGGVDSAVSAALLKEQGYDVVGLFAWIVLPGYPCTAAEDRREALRVAAHLRIPFKEVDLSQAYKTLVFEDAMRSYARGETPNPDALCNREIKFGLLYDFAMQEGADYFATGHYARVKKTPQGEVHLLAGVDSAKDQSYFLWAVPQERLQKTLFPVGKFEKTKVRAMASRFNLPNAARKDSQGLCFLGDVSIEEAITRELHPVPGSVLNEKKEVVGQHEGATLYTPGQRRGFTIEVQTTHENPHFVIAKDILHNTITVSSALKPVHELSRVKLRDSNWIGSLKEGEYMARMRYRQTLFRTRLIKHSEPAELEIESADPIPLGQSLVIYKEQRCLGGGILDKISG